MARYKLTESGVYDREHGRHIPVDIRNTHYYEYLLWVAEGGMADPMDPPPVEEGARRQRRIQLRTDTVIQALANATPQEAIQYIDNNVTDLASAKRVLKALAAAVCVLLKESL